MRNYLNESKVIAKGMLGTRIEIPVHYDLWMRGARTGVVTSIGKDAEFIRVKMDHPEVKKLLKVWRIDFRYTKLI